MVISLQRSSIGHGWPTGQGERPRHDVGDARFAFPARAGLTYYVVVETVARGLLSQRGDNLTVSCP